MTFSVLMSVYETDSAEYLHLALESIYDKQTLKPNEIVIVFDGPITDKLKEVLENFAEDKQDIVKFVPLKENVGLGEALRIGSLECTCDYILRMDSDDISDDLRFEKQLDYMEKHPEIDVLGTDIREFTGETEEPDLKKRICPKDHNDIVKMSKTRNPMNHVTVCIKRSALIKSGGYKSLLLLEDYYLWLRMIAAGCTLANLNEPLVYVRVNREFYGRRGAKERLYGWKVLQKYMLSEGMISRFSAFKNMVCIFGFIYSPAILKKLLYLFFLRK